MSLRAGRLGRSVLDFTAGWGLKSPKNGGSFRLTPAPRFPYIPAPRPRELRAGVLVFYG